MQLKRIVLTTMVLGLVASSSVFATTSETTTSSQPKKNEIKVRRGEKKGGFSNQRQQGKMKAQKNGDNLGFMRGMLGAERDPVEKLNKEKERVNKLLEEKKITEDKANEQIRKIEAKIKEVQEFEALTVEQKREKLLNDLKKEAEERIKDAEENLKEWNGEGRPGMGAPGAKKDFMRRPFEPGMGIMGKGGFDKDPLEMLNRQKERVNKLLDEKKITEDKANEQIKEIDAKINEIQEFEALTVEQKREKLLNGLKEDLAKKVEEKTITQEVANERIKGAEEKLKEWDGDGHPGMFKMLMGRGFRR